MADDRINMTADEFADHWTRWAPGGLSRSDAGLLNDMLVSILTTFEERGSVTHHRQLLGEQLQVIYTSPDSRAQS